jgi:two-component system chemotaxis response regulator CheB
VPAHPRIEAAERGGPIIALVSSAGGLDALTRVLRAMPATIAASVIALQHADPSRESRLATLLDRAGPLPVADARDGETLVPGRVHVAPSGSHTLITTDRTVVLMRSGQMPPNRPSADLLLVSLAVAVGPAAIAVVLTGLGHDGTAGATAVKRLGGTLLASTAATSQESSMPAAAIDTGLVDHELSLHDIGPALARLCEARSHAAG